MTTTTAETLLRFGLSAADLSAPDAARSAGFDFAGLDIMSVASVDDPAFDPGYAALWAEFGDRNELEPRDVLARRLAWRKAPPRGEFAMRYEMIVLRRGAEVAAVCDQTAIVPRHGEGDAVVHFSHVLIAPPYRGSGLAGWLRAWPIATARNCFAQAGLPPRPVTIVAECEPADANDCANVRRLTAFERAGFLKVDPSAVTYLQPDFRPAAVIDATGGPRPLPLSLVIRRVGREAERTIRGGELREMVRAIYAMYVDGFREQDMRPCMASLDDYPAAGTRVALVPPTLVPSPGTPGEG